MKYYIIVASKDHVEQGMNSGFAQAGHGKKSQLLKLMKDDWVIYYSSKEQIKGKAYQKFTAAGQVTDHQPFQVEVNENFKPWRRKIHFYPTQEISIRPLLDDLQFIRNRENWGIHFRSGFLEIGEEDFHLIIDKMLLKLT